MEESGELPERKRMAATWADFRGELKKVGHLVVPLVVVSVLQYLMQVVAVVMVGHLDQLALSSVAIATSLTNVTGFSFITGLAGGLETLCGQAYGAKQHKQVGIYTTCAIISLLLVCVPISVLWIFLDKLLLLIGQDPLIALKAHKFSLWLIPALFSGAIIKPLVRCLQSQSLILPYLISSGLALGFQVPLSWLFVFKLKMGSDGAALAFSLASWFYVILVGLYVRWSPSCEDTRPTFSMDALLSIKEFFRFAVPSSVMACLKWWAVEVLVLVSGMFPNAKLETSVLSLCLTISTLHFTISYGLGAVASTRVSNELGAGNAHAARVAVWTVMFLGVVDALASSVIVFFCRAFLGCAFSKEKAVVSYIAALTPFISLSIITDSLQGVASGIARGSGWQHIGAYVNLGAFYLFGIPTAIVLGFPAHLRAKGLLIGILIGSVIQSIVLSLVTVFTDWQKQATKARERLLKGTSLEGQELGERVLRREVH